MLTIDSTFKLEPPTVPASLLVTDKLSEHVSLPEPYGSTPGANPSLVGGKMQQNCSVGYFSSPYTNTPV